MKLIHLDYSKVEIDEVDGIDHKDYPDYCDAYISKAYIDGQEATQEQLDVLNDNDDYRYNAVMDYIH